MSAILWKTFPAVGSDVANEAIMALQEFARHLQPSDCAACILWISCDEMHSIEAT